MLTMLIVIHVLLCVGLMAIILLQGGKGADLASVFGGGTSGTAFGVTGAEPFVAKVTTAVAVGFLLSCIILSYFYTPSGARSVIQQGAGQQSSQTTPGATEESSGPGATSGTLGTVGTEGTAGRE
ncbi:MAG TPA: preprotein translocase subunit SecG [bacterium]|nr:preprotein translocase subunit SecG [bacterium]